MVDDIDTGFGTSKFMWQLVSEELDGVKLPETINRVLYMLRDGDVVIISRQLFEEKKHEPR